MVKTELPYYSYKVGYVQGCSWPHPHFPKYYSKGQQYEDLHVPRYADLQNSICTGMDAFLSLCMS